MLPATAFMLIWLGLVVLTALAYDSVLRRE